jgi:hypothetical protein
MHIERKFTKLLILTFILVCNLLVINFRNPTDNLHNFVYAQQIVLPTKNDLFANEAKTNQSVGSQNEHPYFGINMRGYYSSMPQGREGYKNPFPNNYYESTFKTLSLAKIVDHVRYRFYWESYERDPIAFTEELEVVAGTADKYGIKVIYDNHQFHTSSWLSTGRGTGFPTYLFNDPVLYKQGGGGAAKYSAAETWWTKWWDRSIKSTNGTDGWTLQANFLKKVVEIVDKHPSTLGYEILSEPQIHSKDQWPKIGLYNTFMTDQLRKVTAKTIIYSVNLPLDQKVMTELSGQNMARMAPQNKKNVVFKMSLYGSLSSGYQSEKLQLYMNASRLAGVPLYVGEWNNVKRIATINEEGKKIWKVDVNRSDISQAEANTLVEKLTHMGIWGMAYWDWSFVPNRAPNFNLVTVAYDNATGESKVQTTKYFQIMKNAYRQAFGY